MQISLTGFELIKKFEGCRLEAYLDSGGLPTIGWGTLKYPPWYVLNPNGRVQMGDRCTQEQADSYFRYDLLRTEKAVDELTIDPILQRHFDALVSLVYNIGEGAFRASTIRRMVNEDADNPSIRQQFLKWVHDNGVIIPGLVNRRTAEANYYFGVTA